MPSAANTALPTVTPRKLRIKKKPERKEKRQHLDNYHNETMEILKRLKGHMNVIAISIVTVS